MQSVTWMTCRTLSSSNPQRIKKPALAGFFMEASLGFARQRLGLEFNPGQAMLD